MYAYFLSDLIESKDKYDLSSLLLIECGCSVLKPHVIEEAKKAFPGAMIMSCE